MRLRSPPLAKEEGVRCVCCWQPVTAPWRDRRPGLGARHRPARSGGGKRPLTYDVYDAWKSIQGTTLSRDGRVAGLRADGAGRRRRADRPQSASRARSTAIRAAPTRRSRPTASSSSSRSCSRRQTRSESASRSGAPGAAARGAAGSSGASPSRNPPRNSAGIMTLATGQVTTVERVGSVRLPEESSTWVALYRGKGGAGRGGRGAAGRGGRAGAGRRPRHPRPTPRPPRRRRTGTRPGGTQPQHAGGPRRESARTPAAI